MTERDPRMSLQTLKILGLLLNQPRESLAGSDIGRETGMLSGTLYPILLRLEKAGWLSSEWEALEPSAAGRPRKRLYQLTGLGYNKARSALAELARPQGLPLWNS